MAGRVKKSGRGRPQIASLTPAKYFDSASARSPDDAKLGKVSPDRINHRGLLPDEQMEAALTGLSRFLARARGAAAASTLVRAVARLDGGFLFRFFGSMR